MAWLSLLPTKLWFDSFILHTLVLAGVLLWSAWNGANFCECLLNVAGYIWLAALAVREVHRAGCWPVRCT